ncbi:MAG TPA: ATP-binding protein [Verrucomicrobiae bacterium]|nr:ATP-binding protein [Verrucomicrobiae bacterium]
MKLDSAFTLENAGWPVLLVGRAGNVVHANAAALALFGPTLETAQPNLTSVWAETAYPPGKFFAEWEHSPVATVSLKFRVQDGTTATFLTTICPGAEAEQKFFLVQLLPESGPSALSLAHKQKLDCALQLARTVSLDFNNALTSILGHTSLLLSKMEPNHPWRTSLMAVEKSAERAAEIASDLGAFSLQEKETRSQSAGNLNVILQRTVELFQASPTPKISWTVHLERKLFSAKFDEAKIQQAFVKILENAVQSISAEGRITVTSRDLELAEPSQDRNARLAAGAYVCVEITDTGSGIDAEVLPRIFEPFFTTKKAPHRGLGLAWVYGIVTNHGGGVAVSSQPEAGTSVRIYLPAERHYVKDRTIDVKELGGDQTILMVDDEELMLTMGETVLSAYGYQVLTANSGAKALEILGRPDAHIDLVVTDLVMPTMSGRELIEHIQKKSPGTQIICTSGFVRPSGQPDDARYLQKPFTSQQLLSKVKQMLVNEVIPVD